MPVTGSCGEMVPGTGSPGVGPFHLKMTVSQLNQTLRMLNVIGAWPLWPAMNAWREEKVAVPSGAEPPVGQPPLMSSLTESE